MNTRHYRRISRSAAERLLDGHAGPGPDQLTRVLAAAAAPARDGELAGEQMAVAAFEAHHLAPVATPRKEHKSMLAKLLTTKILIASLAAFGTGGVALAASNGVLTGPGPAHGAAGASQPTSAGTQPSSSIGIVPGAPVSSQPTAPASNPFGGPGGDTGTQPADTTSPTAQALPQSAAGLCRALAGDVAALTAGTSSQSGQPALSSAGQEQALGSAKLSQVLAKPEFSSLVSTAQSATAVPDYCALLLDLPQLPQPSDLAQLPGTLLGQLLTALSTSTLTQVLTSLPSSTLSQVLTSLPTSALSTILTGQPASTVAQLLNELPSSALSQLPPSVLSQLPASVLSHLPASALSQLGL